MARNKTIPGSNRALPATIGYVSEIRDELKASIRSVDAKMDSGFKAMESRFTAIDSRFIDMESRFTAQDSKIEDIRSMVHRSLTLLENRESRNEAVLEAVSLFGQRMIKLEDRQDENDDTIRSLARIRKRPQ